MSMRTLVAFAALFAAGSVAGAPADLDPAWGEGGVVNGVRLLDLQPDGSALAHREGAVLRLRPSGAVDPGFGGGMPPLGRILSPPGLPIVTGSALRPGETLDIVWGLRFGGTPYVPECGALWKRYVSDGAPDPTFAEVPLQSAVCSYGTFVVDVLGTAYHVGRAGHVLWGWTYWIVQRGREGSVVREFGSYSTSPASEAAWHYSVLRIDAGNRLLVGMDPGSTSVSGLALRRFVDGVADSSFGSGGLAVAPQPGNPRINNVVPLSDGGALAIGVTWAGGHRQPMLARFTERGTLDAAFGTAGVVVVPLSRVDDGDAGEVDAEVMADGRVVLAATVTKALDAQRSIHRVDIARLQPDGSLDALFAPGGIASIRTSGSLQFGGRLAVRSGGEILLSVTAIPGGGAAGATFEPQVLQLRGGDLPAPRPLRERRVVEYFHAGFRHYFITASDAEIAVLDTAPGGGWAHTGRTFNVYDDVTAPLSPVCRFWSDQSFAPRSSHFYTPYAHECELLMRGSTWRYEGTVFGLRMPEGTPGSRTCPPGTQPLYRAYNNNLSGAPNHRYMTDPALLDQMIAQGWTMEGEAATRVFACVPLQP